MIIKANSLEEASQIAIDSFGSKKDFEIYTISPAKKLLGFIKLKGTYKVVLKKIINEKQNYIKDGYIEISSGKLTVKNPVNCSNYAKIIANNPNVDIYKNSIKMNGIFKVKEEDKIELIYNNIQPSVEIDVELSKDELEAKLIIKKSPGKTFYIKDVPKCKVLNLNMFLDFKEIPVPKIDFDKCYNKLIELKIMPDFIDKKAIYNLINSPYGGTSIVAKGKKPINGKDAKVQYYFKNHPYRNPEFLTENDINLYDHTIIPTVEIGDLLAVKTLPPLPGIDGITITGKIIKAKPGRDIPFTSGKGTSYLDNGTKIIAVSSGRPILKNGEISVIPILIISNNVSTETGNIYFDGDVIIKGDVLDNMKVISEGDIIIYGNALHCTIKASGNIKILSNAINSKIIAGSNILIHTTISPAFESILSYLGEIIKSLGSLKDFNYIKKRALFIKIISDYSSKVLSKIDEIENIIGLLESEEKKEISLFVKKIKITFFSISNFVPDSALLKLNTLYKELDNFILLLKNSYSKYGNIIFNYAQNSLILSNGSVYATGNGSFQSKIIAKYSIIFHKPSSIVRGGLLIAGKKMKLGIVGSPAGIPTYCKVIDKNGKISTSFCYDNATIKIDHNTKVYNNQK